MSQETKFNEGLVHFQAGEKAISKSFFKWTQEWEVGASEFSQAATQFKIAKAHEQAKEAFKKCAECQLHSKSPFLAAQALENAAVMASELKRYDEVLELSEQASTYYISAGNADRAATSLASGGKMLALVNVEKAIELYIKACDHYEEEGREQFSIDTFNAAIGLTLKNKRYEQASSLMERQMAIYRKMDRKSALQKTILSRLIVLLSIPDVVGAQSLFQTCLQQDGFLNSDEAKGGQSLLSAFESGQADALTKVVAQPLFTYLDNEVAKLARSLPSMVGTAQSEANQLL